MIAMTDVSLLLLFGSLITVEKYFKQLLEAFFH